MKKNERGEFAMHFCAANRDEMIQALSAAIGELIAEDIIGEDPDDCDLPWEKQEQKVVEHCVWTAGEIRYFCTEEGYYTEGNVRDYEEMLLFVDKNNPTPENIYKVAKNILDHSDSEHKRRIEYMMREISVNIVNRYYEVRE